MTRRQKEIVLLSVIRGFLKKAAKPSGDKDMLSGTELPSHHHYESIQVVVDQLRPSQVVVDALVRDCLKRYKSTCRRIKRFPINYFADSDALILAAKLTDYGASSRTIEIVVMQMTKHGWLWAEEVARSNLHRGLTRQEVFWLVESYVTSIGRSENTEKNLRELANEYLNSEDRGEVSRMLQEFAADYQKNSVSI